MSMATSAPRVSVIIPAYNGDRYIAQAVKSVLSQTYSNWEIIVVDDGSTDDTRQALQPYFDRIRYVYQQNQGVAAARNRGIQEAQGELVAFLDQDDFFLSDKLAAQVALFDAQPSLGIVNSGWRIVNEKGDAIADIKPWENLPKLDLETWIVHLPVLPSAMMFSRKWLERSGGFDSRFDSVDDSELVVRLASLGCEAAWVPQIAACYRQHSRNVSIQRARKQAELCVVLKQNFFKQANLPPEIRQLEKPAFYEALTWMAWQLYYSGHQVQMAEYFQKSLPYTPYSPAQTVIDWLKRLTAISKGYGYKLDLDLIRNLPEWKQLMTNIFDSNKPRVSVIIPTYNCDRYIVQAVESVLSQSYKSWEIIVVDDGSTDNTRQVLAPYLDIINYIYQDNQGAAIARNHACQLAQGEFLAFLDADDYFLPEKLAKQVACFNNNPSLGMVQGGWLIVDREGKSIYDIEPWHHAPELNLETWVLHKPVRPSAMMLRREWWERVGGFDSRFPPTEDLDFALRLALKGCQAEWLREVCACYRQHESNLMSGGSIVVENTEIVMHHFFSRPDLPEHIRQLKPIERYHSFAWMAWRMYRDGYFQQMAECLEKSLFYSPFPPAQTVSDWLIAFGRFSAEYGHKFDIYALSQLEEWQQVILTAMSNPAKYEAGASNSISKKHQPHILVYAEDPGVGGVALFNHSLLCKLVSVGYRVTCAQARASNPFVNKQQQLGVEFFWLEFDTMKELSRIAYHPGDADKVFKSCKPDLIIFSDGWPLSNLAAKQVAIQQGIPYLIILHYIESICVNFSRGDGVSYADAVSCQYTLAKSVAAVSYATLNLLKKIFKVPSDLGKVIYSGRENSYFEPPNPATRLRLRRELGIPEDAVVCFTAARLIPVKGYQYQLQAIAQLKQNLVWSKLYFVWAGPGSTTHDNMEPEIKETINKLGINEQIKLLGQRWDIPDWLDASDIFILPSHAEGMPLAVMEAMAKGLPVIATAVSGIPEELGETGKLLPDPNTNPTGTIRELADTIEAWAANPELMRSLGQECKLRAEKMFREERMLEEYAEWIAENLSSDNGTPQFHSNQVSGQNKFESHLKIYSPNSSPLSVVLQKQDAPANSYSDNYSIQRKLPEKWQMVEKRLHYNSLVWDAWYSYYQGNTYDMVWQLREAWKCTPFFATETVMHWVQSFANFYAEKGETLDTYSLINSEEWQELVTMVVGFDLSGSGR